MDTLLVDGDHAVDGCGIPIQINGAEELVQRALIRLGVRRGSFFADPSLGSELYRLPAANTETARRMAHGFVQEALLGLPELSVVSVGLHRPLPGTLVVQIVLQYGKESYQLEVEL